MHALKTGIDAQSEIIPGEDPAALEHFTAQYYRSSNPQARKSGTAWTPPAQLAGSSAASAKPKPTSGRDWENRAAVDKKYGHLPNVPIQAAVCDNQQKTLERLQRRLNAVERSLRASLEAIYPLRELRAAQELSANPNPGQAMTPSDPDPAPGNPDAAAMQEQTQLRAERDPQVCAGPAGPQPPGPDQPACLPGATGATAPC